MKVYFELFDVYLRESPSDSGMLLASKYDLEEILIAVLEKMRATNLEPGPKV